MNTLRVLLATTLFAIVFSEDRVFKADQIACVATEHDLSKHFDACKIFYRKLGENAGGVVTCKIANDAENKIMSGCSPAFGKKDDIIKVDYVVSYNKNLDTWTLTAHVLLWKVYHPAIICLMAVLFVGFIILSCMFPPHHSSHNSYDSAFLGAFLGSSFGSSDCNDGESVSWNHVKED